ncbi:hypothetical protein SCLCIDRAFT_9359 [Scleroderma citrinum Foug A]|uniref:DUF6532 domain-containing protein n=1 Tax=Scleroderma citrinum Foug A TaxID=1036808 RepID=A0A0C3DM03_9AGAM|nr:hypothetical protein SCLCIDRAFT_9359 [Scleroderma citrinum Foug A]
MKKGGRKNIKKPGRGSNLNPCQQSDASQLGNPNELPHKSHYPALVDMMDTGQHTDLFDDQVGSYEYAGGSSLGTFVSGASCLSSTQTNSMTPSVNRNLFKVYMHSKSTAPQKSTGDNSCLQGEIPLSASALHPPVGAPISNNTSVINQVAVAMPQGPLAISHVATPPTSPLDEEQKKRIVSEAKSHLQQAVLCEIPFPSKLEMHAHATRALEASIDAVLPDRQRWQLDDIRSEKTTNSVISTANSMRLSFKNNARTLVRTMYNVLPDSGLGLTELSNIKARDQVKQRVCALLQDYSFLYEQMPTETNRDNSAIGRF